jgi:hypothetical protein
MLTWTRALGCLCVAVAGLADPAYAADSVPAVESPDQGAPYALPIDETDPEGWATPREVFVDTSGFTGVPGGDTVVYDLDLIVSSIRLSQVDDLPPWAVAVRLLLAEVGDRVVHSRYGLVEAVGVVQSIQNRLDRNAWNPDGVSGIRPWPGCGGGDFHACVNDQQYQGLSMPHSLTPLNGVRNRERLYELVDAAVSAWWIAENGYVDDVTNGGTAFVHRCGGAAYGQARFNCDGRNDVSGAQANTGPIVFRGAGEYSRSLGRYELIVTRTIDFVQDSKPVAPGTYARYLWGDSNGEGWDPSEFQTDPDELDALWSGDLTAIVDGLPRLDRTSDGSEDSGDSDEVVDDTGFGPPDADENQLDPALDELPDDSTTDAPETPSTPTL